MLVHDDDVYRARKNGAGCVDPEADADGDDKPRSGPRDTKPTHRNDDGRHREPERSVEEAFRWLCKALSDLCRLDDPAKYQQGSEDQKKNQIEDEDDNSDCLQPRKLFGTF